MKSERLRKILKAKSEFSDDEIEAMTDKEGWDWVYEHRSKQQNEKLAQICFTGFSPSEKSELSRNAKETDLEVVKSVTKNLSYLCIGNNAGPSKLKKAKEQDVTIMNREKFENLIETGEIP